MRQLIKTSGEVVELENPLPMEGIRAMLGAVALDTVLLADRKHVMLVDDLSYAKELPINVIATELYWAKCIPGTTHMIRGNVVVTLDSEF